MSDPNDYRVYPKSRSLKEDEIEPLVCSSCQCFLRNPVQAAACGHRFCRSCVNSILKSGQPRCPKDGQVIKKQEIREDKGCLKDLQGYEFVCKSHSHVSPSLHHLEIQETNQTCEDELCSTDGTARSPTSDHYFEGRDQSQVVLSRFHTVCQVNQEDLQKSRKEVSELQHQHELERRSQRQCCSDEDEQTLLSSLTRYARNLCTSPQNDHKLEDKYGELIWKIPDILQLHKDMLRDEKHSVCSPVFYSSPGGYAMFIRAYLNGEGAGRDTHMSIFFSILQSENDNKLKWPFNKTVQIMLINHQNEGASITRRIIPYADCPTFQRPEYLFSMASGFPKFAPVSVLLNDNFTESDTITIQCTVLNPTYHLL